MFSLEGFFKGNYKAYMLLPLALFIAFLFLVFVFPTVPRGIDLEGGTMIVAKSPSQLDAKEVETFLKQKFDLTDLSVIGISTPNAYGLTIQFAKNVQIATAEQELEAARNTLTADPAAAKQHAMNAINAVEAFASPAVLPQEAAELIAEAQRTLNNARESFQSLLQQSIVNEFNLPKDTPFQIRSVGAALGQAFWQTAITVAVIALVLVIIVIFIFFREVIPSAAVIAAAVFDICGALGLMALFQFPLSLNSVPALLMLVGYSVDTDIMLTTRLLKRKEKNPVERTADSMRTGLTMTLTTIAAVTVMLVMSFFSQMFVIFEIAAVLLFGLLADLVSTWFMNAPLLLWYIERKKGAMR